MRFARLALVAPFALTLSACGQSGPAENEPEFVLGDRPKIFNQCASCHGVAPDAKLIGPSLAGVFGAKAGHVGDFAYSSAMRESGLTWDEASLDAYLANPQAAVPGTKMSFGGLKSTQKRAEIIAYLKTL